MLKISVDENNIIHLELAGNLSEKNVKEFQKWADEVHQTMLETNKKTGDKIRFFTDATKLESMDEKIMGIYNDLLKKDLLYVKKSATFGANTQILVMLTTLMVTSNRPNFQHFKTKEEALEWLMSENNPLK